MLFVAVLSKCAIVFHVVSTLPLNLTRDPVNECTAAPSCTSCAAFAPSYINAPHGRTFVAEIGVSGGAQGYQAITGVWKCECLSPLKYFAENLTLL